MDKFSRWILNEIYEYFMPLIPVCLAVILSLIVVNYVTEEYALKVIGLIFLLAITSIIFLPKRKK